MKKLICASAIATILSGCQSGAFLDVLSSDVVDRTYSFVTVNTTLGSTTIEVAAKAKEHQGTVMVCVAVAGDGKGVFGTQWPAAVADALIVDLDDSRLITGTPFAAQYLREATVVGKTSQCAKTERPWIPRYRAIKLELDIPRISVS